MANNPIMAYIRELARLRGKTLKEVHEAAGVSPNYISRAESGDTQEPSARILVSLVTAVRGQLSHLDTLLKPDSTIEQAVDLATKARAMTDVELEQTISILEKLRDNPKLLDQWIKIGKTLADE